MKQDKIKRFIKKLTSKQKYYRRRILQISYEAKASHIGSCFSAIDIITAIYNIKKKNEKFILSAGHAGVALYAILENYGYLKKSTLKNLNIHPDRNKKHGIHVSSGSLGQGLPIAVGIAFANREKDVYCLISDGECAEGSIWEAVRIAGENKLSNLKIIVNANAYGAYGVINTGTLAFRFKSFGANVLNSNGHDILDLSKKLKKKYIGPVVIIAKTTVDQLPILKGQDAHYKVMSDMEFTASMNMLNE